MAARTAYTARGRVGVNSAKLIISRLSSTRLRFDCEENPEFWLELDLVHNKAKGRGFTLSPRFTVSHDVGSATWRVDDEDNFEFWLQVDAAPQQRK